MQGEVSSSAASCAIPPVIARAISMVRQGFDVGEANPGFQRRILERRRRHLREGFAEVWRKAPHLVPFGVYHELREIEMALITATRRT